MSNAAFALVDSTFEPFRAGELWVKPASEHWEKQAYFALRRSVFSDEQQLLVQDKDSHDFQAIAIVALAGNCGIADQVVGAVRTYQPEPGRVYKDIAKLLKVSAPQHDRQGVGQRSRVAGQGTGLRGVSRYGAGAERSLFPWPALANPRTPGAARPAPLLDASGFAELPADAAPGLIACAEGGSP